MTGKLDKETGQRVSGTIGGSGNKPKPNNTLRRRTANSASVVALCALVIATIALVMSAQNRRNESESKTGATTQAQAPLPGATIGKDNAQPTGQEASSAKPPKTPGLWADPSPVPSAAADVHIDRALNLKLLHNAGFQRYPIDASSENSRIILRGSVPTQQLKARAESIAKSIPGVRGVTDHLTVEPIH
ncbi:MAG: BON domain-containing protein [Blastocatellia bacterium]